MLSSYTDSSLLSSYTYWYVREVVPSEEGGATFEVYNNQTEEVHRAYSYKSAQFLKNLFNEQYSWIHRNAWSTVTISGDHMICDGNTNIGNVHIRIGNPKSAFSINYYDPDPKKNTPNRFQRYLLAKIMAIHITTSQP